MNIHQFKQENSVTYRGECYLARDNGAICRLRHPNKRKRPLDDKWTFGNPCASSGYMKISSLVVHRIVATAFHGEQPSPEHVVDHIDTNRMNNRPENLRWVTRLENILDNPKTLRRIENTWGSVENLFNDPNPAEKTVPLSNYSWMRRAFIEEMVEEVADIESLTPLAMQRNWKTPSKFPMCPDKISDDSILDYASRLDLGTVFSRNEYGESIVITSEISKDCSYLSVLCKIESGMKSWALSKIIIEEGKFIHENKRSFFTFQGAVKSHCLLIGEPWEESIDDFC